MPTAHFTHILCPVDFSDASMHAAEHATTLAGWYGAHITAQHVYAQSDIPIPSLTVPVDRLSGAERHRLQDQTAACFRKAVGAGVELDVAIDIGHPVREILARASAIPADLIVMGTHGTSGFEHLVLGSVTEKVLRRAPCAVLTVPPRAHAASTLPFKRLLCAVDFSDPSLAAADVALSIAREAGAALTLLCVVEWPWLEPPPPVFEELPPEPAAALAEYRRYVEKSATNRLQGLLPDEVRNRSTPATRVVHGKPYVEILRAAADASVDLIVMGVHGRNAFDMMVFGSTTNHVVRAATCPVLTLRQ